MQNVFQEEHNF